MIHKLLRLALASPGRLCAAIRGVVGRAAKGLVSRVGLGAIILAATAAIYLWPHISDVVSCVDAMLRGLIAGRPVGWQCLKNALADLRQDGTAATVILAIAAAVLASAWRSGGSSAAE